MADDETPGTAPSTPMGRLRASAEAAAEPLVGGVTSAIGAAIHAMPTLPGHRVRAVRRRGHLPLPSLPDRHPEARRARPVEVGFRTIDVADIEGTAVGGGDQRGGDFLPLRQFRGANWKGRWQRLRRAHERLVDLPPIDVVKYDGRYWVIDGHNRVALALYTGQGDIDATVVELVPPGQRRTEPIGTMVAEVEASRMVRGRVETASAADAVANADVATDGEAGPTAEPRTGEAVPMTEPRTGEPGPTAEPPPDGTP